MGIPALVDAGAQVSIMTSRVAEEEGCRVIPTQLRILVGVGKPG